MRAKILKPVSDTKFLKPEADKISETSLGQNLSNQSRNDSKFSIKSAISLAY